MVRGGGGVEVSLVTTTLLQSFLRWEVEVCRVGFGLEDGLVGMMTHKKGNEVTIEGRHK